MINTRFLKSLIIILITILLIMYLFQYMHDKFPTIDKSNLISGLVMTAFILAGFYNFVRKHSVKNSINQMLIWCLIFLIIVTFYAFRFEMKYVYQRVASALVPSYSWINDQGQITISRSNDGHFYINAIVNDVEINFMIDTGASDVALTRQDAAKLKFNLSKLKFTRRYNTANGISFAAPVILNTFKIGNTILFNNVNAHIGEGELDISLLGMSVIERFMSFRIDKDLLILTIGDSK